MAELHTGFEGTGDIDLLTNSKNISALTFTGTNLTIDTSTLFVDSTNKRVGIGILTPQKELHIHKATGVASQMSFTNSDTGSTATDGTLVGISGGADMYIWNYEATNLYLGTTNTTRLFIKSSGEVGIGTTSTTGVLNLHHATACSEYFNCVANTGYSSLIFQENGANKSYFQHINSNFATAARRNNMELYNDVSGGDITFHNDSATPTLTARSTGISIKTTNATYTGEFGTATNYQTLRLAGPNIPLIKFANPNYNGGNGLELYQNNAGTFYFNINSTTTAMAIDSAGKVGIGTATPRSALDMGGTSGTQGAITFGRKDISASSDTTDVSGCNLLRVSTAGGDRTLGGLTGGTNGQMLIIQKYSSSNNLILEHVEGVSAQDFVNVSAGDVTLAPGYKAIIYICDGSNWFEILKA